jgi:8-oxo-dGTP pyrophosphatase MutT (NUDIX family)
MKGADTVKQGPRPAATVILTRQSGEGIQVYLIRRSIKSAFMPGNYVFPGGNLDPDDWDVHFWKGHIDLNAREIDSRLGGGLNREEAVAYGMAAVRETFEEAGVLLIGQAGEYHEGMERVCELRRDRELSRTWLKEWTERYEWTIGFSRLGRWSHWITPKARSHRYDTRFFTAAMPEGQECVPDRRETTQGIWVSPEEGLMRNMGGEIPLSPPALMTLHQLLPYKSWEELKKEAESRPWGQPCLSIFKRFPEGQLILFPGDPDYGNELETDMKILSKKTIRPGNAFTRLWCEDGVWRPVEAG